ncbi:MAG: hypothetical protein ACT4O2_14760, partial [Beijerinckiaceae bacterium]
ARHPGADGGGRVSAARRGALKGSATSSGRGRRGGEAANFAVQHGAAAPQTGLLSPPPRQKLEFLEVPRRLR